MDGVEIVMAVEEAFNICIEDSEVEKLLTPGDLIDLVVWKTGNTKADVCLSHRSFNLARKFFVKHCGISRREVAPKRKLQDLLPLPGRRGGIMAEFASTLAVPAPVLVRPDWLSGTIAAGVLFFAAIALVESMRFNWPMVPAVLGAVGIAGYAGMIATAGLKREFPKRLSTVEDLAKWIIAHKRDLAMPQEISSSWTREQVALRVKEVVVEILGCEAIYREDALFVKELGMD